MTSELAEWIDRRYSLLWEAFSDKPYRFEDAAKGAEREKQRELRTVPVFSLTVTKSGYLSAEY
jgi:hypothetical protein